MAQLNISEITNDGKGVDKSYRGDILLDKIFNKNKRTSEFNTTKGILIASSIEINDNKFAKYMQSAYSELQSLPSLPQRQRKVIIKGKINKKTVDIKLNEIVKTEEFGGQRLSRLPVLEPQIVRETPHVILELRGIGEIHAIQRHTARRAVGLEELAVDAVVVDALHP